MTLSLKEWRRLKDISQGTMAQRLNIHINTYQKWEKEPGKINMDKAIEISQILGVSMNDISFKNKEMSETICQSED